MNMQTNRRAFLGASAAGGALVGFGRPGLPVAIRAGLGRRGRPRPQGRAAPAGDRAPGPPAGGHPARRGLLEEVAARIKKGLSYRDVAGGAAPGRRAQRAAAAQRRATSSTRSWSSTRPIWPASASPDTDRWLPIFWALDYFKNSQAQDVREGNWTMGPVDESAVPPRPQGPRRRSPRPWTTGTRRPPTRPSPDWPASAGTNEIYELFVPLRRPRLPLDRPQGDLRGQQLADAPVHRLAARRARAALAGLRAAEARAATTTRPSATTPPTARAAQPGARGPDQRRLDRRASPTPSASADLLATLAHRAPTIDACEQVVELLNRGVAAQSIWDALFDGAGRVAAAPAGASSRCTRSPSTNALHFAYQASGDDQTRRLLMLQNAAFLPLFRDAMGGRGKVGEARIDELEPTGASTKDGAGAIEEIFAEASRDRMTAARKALAYLQAGHDPRTADRRGATAGVPQGERRRTTTSSARPCWRTITTPRPPGASATWPSSLLLLPRLGGPGQRPGQAARVRCCRLPRDLRGGVKTLTLALSPRERGAWRRLRLSPSPCGLPRMRPSRGGPSRRKVWRHMKTGDRALTLARRLLICTAVGVAMAVMTYLSAWQSMRDAPGYRWPHQYTLEDLRRLAAALDEDYKQKGSYPATLADLKSAHPDDVHLDDSGEVVDRWDRPYQYRAEGNNYTLFSLGRDGKPGGVGLDEDLDVRDSIPQKDGHFQLPDVGVPTLRQFTFECGTGGVRLVSALAGVFAFVACLVSLRMPRRAFLGTLILLGLTLVACLVTALTMSRGSYSEPPLTVTLTSCVSCICEIHSSLLACSSISSIDGSSRPSGAVGSCTII